MTHSRETIAEAHDRSILDTALALGADRILERQPKRGVPCPGCGGDDRFSLDPDKNVFFCRASGAGGDPIDLVRHVQDCDFGAAVGFLTSASRAASEVSPAGAPAGRATTRGVRSDADGDNAFREAARKRARRIWDRGYSIDPAKGGRVVVAYLARRGIPFPGWRIPALREVDRLKYWHPVKGRRGFEAIHEGPAMMAAITGPDGRFIGVHRTWIDLDQRKGKAEIVDPETGEFLPAKKVEGTQRGGIISLRTTEKGARHVTADSDTPLTTGAVQSRLAIGEGIETVLAWAALNPGFDGALWSGINLDNIAGKATGTIAHPTRTLTDVLGRVRRARVGGPDPRADDTGCLAVPAGRYGLAILLGDGDGDGFATRAAMMRAEKRFARAGLAAETDFAPEGMDWNDALRARMREGVAA